MRNLMFCLCSLFIFSCSPEIAERTSNPVAVKTSSETNIDDNRDLAPQEVSNFKFSTSNEELEKVASIKLGSDFTLKNKKVKNYYQDESAYFVQLIGSIENGEKITLALPARLAGNELVLK